MRRFLFTIVSMLLAIGMWAQTKPSIKLLTSAEKGKRISINIQVNEGACQVDLGDGTLVSHTTGFFRGTLAGNYVAIYGNVGGLAANAMDITGIELDNTQLTILNLNDNKIATLSLPRMPQLKSLALQGNLLTTFTLKDFPSLETLNLKLNQLTSVTLSKLPAVKTMMLSSNKLTQLELSEFASLQSLRVDKNQLSSLAFPTGLKELYADDNLLVFDGFTFEGYPTMERLRMNNNRIRTLSVKNCPVLNDVEINANGTSQVKIDNLPALSVLYLKNNQLSATELNAVYDALPTVAKGSVKVEGNEGATKARSGIATNKGWTVDVAGVAQRVLEEGVDYMLSADKKTLLRWFAEDLTTLDMMQDKQLAQVESIGEYCFYSNVVLNNVILPETLKTIEAGAFSVSALKEIVIPRSVKAIGKKGTSVYNPFSECLSLGKIEVAEGNRYYKVLDGFLMTKDGTKLVAYATGLAGAKASVPQGVEYIASGAFAGALYLKEVALPTTVQLIDRYAFQDAGLLEKIALNDGLVNIGFGAFVRTKIQEIMLPASFRFVRDGVLYESPFLGCADLRTIQVDAKNTEIKVDKDGAVYSADMTVLFAIPASNGMRQYNAPSSLREIAQAAVTYHKTLSSVTIAPCIDLPLRAFEGCSALASLRMETGTPSIASQCFQHCTALRSLYLLGRGLPTITAVDAFQDVPMGEVTLYTVEADKDLYKNHELFASCKHQVEKARYEYIPLHREQMATLPGIDTTSPVYNLHEDVAPLRNNQRDVVGNIVGQTSIIAKEGAQLYLVDMRPKYSDIVEPLLSPVVVTAEEVAEYEKMVAHRTEVKREDQFGGVLVTYADSKVPGVEAKYLFFGNDASSYVTLVFDSKKVFDGMHGSSFYAERYTAASGIDVDGENFEGFARLKRIGYEYREFELGEETADPTINIAYFRTKEVQYKPITLDNQTIASPVSHAVSILGNTLYNMTKASLGVVIYTLDGQQVAAFSTQATEYALPALDKGNYLVVVDLPSHKKQAIKWIR